MAVRGTDGDELRGRWVFGVRYIEGIDEDRAKLRATAMFRVTPSFQIGVEYSPLADDVGPLANWRALDETESMPAIVLGTSSDRIGTPRGRAFYATASKDLERWTGLPVAPYVGASYGTFEDELLPIGGLHVRYGRGFSSSHLYDGEDVHHLLNWRFLDRHAVGLLLVDHRYPGISYGVSFDF